MTEKEAINVANMAQALRAGAGRAASAVGGVAKSVAGIPGEVGDIALQVGRRGLNAIGGVKNVATGLGDATIGAAQRAAGRVVGQPRTGRFNPLNVGTGVGVMGLGAKALSGAGASASPAVPAAPSAGPAAGPQSAGGFGGMSQRAQQMWGALPTEAKWAIGAGVPLALLGGYMGRKGGLGGLGLGALGLGAAALGGASGGLFGDNARRFSGKMLYNMGSFFGGKNDHASQLGMLSKLSPGMGATVLMGRDPNLSSEDAMKQYEFLTKNRDMIQKMLPTLTAKSAGELAKAARCWKGYEPVPGKAPYSEDSCRPAGSKKKKKEKNAASALFHHATKDLEPVVNGHKPAIKHIKHVKVVHHNPDGQGVDLKPEEAKMQPDMKPAAD